MLVCVVVIICCLLLRRNILVLRMKDMMTIIMSELYSATIELIGYGSCRRRLRGHDIDSS